MKRLLKALLTVVLITAGAAQAIPLSDLFAGGTVTAGDKLFDQWTLNSYTASDPLRLFNAANIDVTALSDGGLDPGPGLQFGALNGELSVTGDDIFAFVDLMFGFRVSVLDPVLRIKDNSLQLGSATLIDPAAIDLGIFILETIGTAPGQDNLGSKNVEFSILDDVLTSNLSDSANFAPQNEIWVTKNILVWAQDSTDSASLNGFTQRFSQTTVPEPATALLLAAALTVLFVVSRFARRV